MAAQACQAPLGLSTDSSSRHVSQTYKSQHRCTPSLNKKVVTDEKQQETVTIFDWDDTLLPSTFLSSNGYRLDSTKEMPEEMQKQISTLQDSVVSLIQLALDKRDTVYIITNAEEGWVELSAQKFMPAVVPMLSRLEIISARSTYEYRFPQSPLQWKYYAFQHNLEKAFKRELGAKCVISFGDSQVERQVVRAVSKTFHNSIAKSIKFAERPSLEQLQRQVELVSKCFENVYSHQGDLDLMLTISLTSEKSS